MSGEGKIMKIIKELCSICFHPPSLLCSKTKSQRKGTRALLTVVVLVFVQAYVPAALGVDTEVSVNAPETVSGDSVTIDLNNVIDLDTHARVELGVLII